MSSPNSGDLLLVNRGGVNYQIDYNDMSTLQDTDLLLVNRGGTNYQLAAVDLDLKSGSMGSPVEVLSPVDGAGVGGAINFTGKTSNVATVTQSMYSGFCDASEFGMTSSQYGGVGLVEGQNGRIVGVAQNGGIFYTDDGGLTFTQPNHPGDDFKDICYNGSIYVCVGVNGNVPVIYSSDGQTWSQPNSNPSNLSECYSCAANPATGRIVICGRTNNASDSPYAYSSNGSSWSSSNTTSQQAEWYMSGNNQTRYIIKFGGGKFVTEEYTTGGWSNYRASEYSSDGINWSYVNPYHTGYSTGGIVYAEDQNLWVMVVCNSSNHTYIKTSSDGITWNRQSSAVGQSYNNKPATNGANNVTYGNGIFLYGLEAGNGYYFTQNGDLDNWGLGYTSDSNRIYGGSYVNNKFILTGNSPRGLYFSQDMTTEDYAQNLGATYLTSYDVMQYDLTFENSNVYDASTGNIVETADFVEVFDRTLTRTTNSDTPIFNPTAISPGALSLTYVNLQNDFVPGFDHIRTNSALSIYGPSPSEVEFTSQNSGTTPVSASDATLSFRKWTLETRASSSDPWTLVVEADDYSPVGSQNGSTPWATKPTLQPNTQYRVKVAYNSSNAREVVSDYSYFTTGNS